MWLCLQAVESILFQALCSSQNLKNMKFWKADLSDMEFQIRNIQSIYFLHRFSKKHWKWGFLEDNIPSLIGLFSLSAVFQSGLKQSLTSIWYIRSWDSSTTRSSIHLLYHKYTAEPIIYCVNCSFFLHQTWRIFCCKAFIPSIIN